MMRYCARALHHGIYALVLLTAIVVTWPKDALGQDSRPKELQVPVLSCAKTVPVFFDDPNFLLGYTLQEPAEDWLPDRRVWKSREGNPKASGQEGETRVAIYKTENFGHLQARFKKLIDFNFAAETLREIRITLQDIVIETLTDTEPVTPNLDAVLLSKPYVRTLVRANAITIVAIRENGVIANIELFKKLIPFLQSPRAEAIYKWDDKTKAITLGKRTYFQACTSNPPKSMLDVTKNPIKIMLPYLRDGFQMHNISNTEIKWIFKDIPDIVSIHGHYLQGKIDAHGLSDLVIVRGHEDAIAAQKVREHIFVIASYDDSSILREIKIITDDPNNLKRAIMQRYSIPSPR